MTSVGFFARIKAVVPGSQTFITQGSFSFTVPRYNTLYVYADGGVGPYGANGADLPGGDGTTYSYGGAGGPGGPGGQAYIAYTRGSGPTPGSSVTITVFGGDGQSATFQYGGGVYGMNGYTGGTGGAGTYDGNGAPGAAGSPGGAGGGTSNVTGGSGYANPQVYVSWS